MNKLYVKNWLINLKLESSIQVITIEGIDFEVMALSQQLIDDIKSCVDYEEAINIAATAGLVLDGKRAVDDQDIAGRLGELWSEEYLKTEVEPSIKEQVGLKVCDISGINSVIEEVHLDGDGDMPLHENMGKIQEEMNAQNNIQQG